MKSFYLKENTCKETAFNLTPKKEGETEIYFNIKALDFREHFTREIKIERA